MQQQDEKRCYNYIKEQWHLHSWRVVAHVVDSTAGGMDPAVAQSLLQCCIRDVEDDNQVELNQMVQSLGLRQRAWKTYKEIQWADS